MSPQIRTLAPEEVERLVDWAAEEGWNPGIGDAAAFRRADPDGFLGLFVDGTMAAGISAVAYGEDFGFIGLYICHPAFRGRGLGRAVWNAGMARLGGRTVGLDGVPEQQGNYRRMGFEEAYGTTRYTGPSSDLARLREMGGGWATHPCSAEWFDAVTDMDRACFPARRAEFMARWLEPPRHAVVAERAGRLGGFGAVRRCRSGWKVGPLFAEDHEAAAAILSALAVGVDGPLSLDVPDSRTETASRLAAIGFEAAFSTARMYRGGTPPAFRTSWVHAVTTLELG